MQFKIDVEEVEDGWSVEVTNFQTGEPVIDPVSGKPFVRVLRRVGEGLKSYPQPPENEANNIPSTPEHPHRALCVAQDASLIGDIYQNILRRQANDVVKFGRYLFATLLGDALWDALNALATEEPLELALWSSAFHRSIRRKRERPLKAWQRSLSAESAWQEKSF